MELILAEQVLLLALDDEKGSDRTSYGVEPGLSGALLMDLGPAGGRARGGREDRCRRGRRVAGSPRSGTRSSGSSRAARYPEADPEPEREIRERLGAVLLDGREPDLEEAMLLSLLSALVPDDVHATLRRRAATAGQSLQEYLLASLVREAHQQPLEEVLERAGGRAGGTIPLRFAADSVRSDRERA